MIEAYIICWNEADTINLTINHYERFCDRIHFYDNLSTDGTDDIIRSRGHHVTYFGKRGELDDQTYLDIKNYCWKTSKADWVIVCDCDEIIYHPNLKDILSNETATVFRTIGVEMYSNEMPNEDFLELNEGVLSKNYAKTAIFSPKIKSINFKYGCHQSDPCGNVHYSKEKLYLYHYRNIGGFDRLQKRHESYAKRLSNLNKEKELGIHYLQDEKKRQDYWNKCYSEKVKFNSNWVV